jgi:hypothetical protein
MVLHATFNNISVISWWSVFLVEDTRVPEEIAPLVKWSLRLPYTFLSVGSPFIEEEGKMP